MDDKELGTTLPIHRYLHSQKLTIFVGFGCLIFAGLYLVQIWSPLRLNTDAYRLLSMAVSAHDGNGYLVDGEVDQFPTLYPFFIKVLLDHDLATSGTVIFFNLFWLCVGLIAYLALSREHGRLASQLGLIWMLSSWVLCKHVVLPLTDTLYLGLSVASVYAGTRFLQQEGARKWPDLLLSLFLAYLALQCRTIGIALFPALFVGICLHRDHAAILRSIRKHWIRSAACMLGFSTVFLVGVFWMSDGQWFQTQFVNKSSYFSYLWMSISKQGVLDFFVRNLVFRLTEFGEIFLNVPATKLPVPKGLLVVPGVILSLLLCLSIMRAFVTKNHIPAASYLLAYGGVMVIWPYYDARFWMPVFPIAVVLLISASAELLKQAVIARAVLWVYLCSFVALGFIAMALITRTSLSGERFSEHYGDGTDRMTYRFAMDNGLAVDPEKVNYKKVELLKRFTR